VRKSWLGVVFVAALVAAVLAALLFWRREAAAKPSAGDRLIAAVLAPGDVAAIQELLDSGVDINGRNFAGLTAYQAARLLGDAELVQFLASHGADTNIPAPTPEKLADALFSHIVASNGPGAALLIARDGKILLAKGYGMADVERRIPFSAVTESRIGSITKQFTSAAILRLQERGKLSIDDKLTNYFPGFPRGQEVTLRHLLTHTSGIRSYTDKPGFLAGVSHPIKPEDLINSFKNEPFDFEPGKKWHYDNSGYFLLGKIVEKVSGQSYGDFLQSNFFAPLGMSNTGVYHAGAGLEHEALGYSFSSDGKFSKALNWDMSWAGGAGALYSTVEDLYRWDEALFGGKVLSETSLKAAWTPVKTEEVKDDNSGIGYGFGWAISRLRGAEEIVHSGGLDGFSSFLLRLPQYHFTIAVLANALPGPTNAPSAQAEWVAQIYLGAQLGPRCSGTVNASVSPAAYDALVGRYDYEGPILTVTREGSRLYAQLGQQPRFQIYPASETNFFWKVVNAQVTFVKNGNGKVVKAIHHQNGHIIVAPRLPDLAEARVNPADYDAFAGKYDYGGGAILTVKRTGSHLYAQLTGQSEYEIFPASPTKFFWKVVDAQVEFVKNDQGKVVKAIHHQGGQTLTAPKIR
jgi:CubicO group peptidase (beta-lactamase class C family)